MLRIGMLSRFMFPLFDAASDAAAAGGGGTPPVIKSLADLPPELKEEMNRTISARINEEKAKWQRPGGKTPDQIAAEDLELQRLRDQEKERERKELEKKGEYDRIIES